MKLVLIIPPSPWLISDRDIPMMGVLYLSSYLKANNKECEVVVCDLSSLKEEDWYIPVGDIYGVTGVSPQYIYIEKIIRKLKIREPDKLVIVGGVHATTYPDHILINTLADACVVGEGELPLLQLMSGIIYSRIDGIKTRFEYKPNNCLCNVDLLPFPDRETIDYFSYLVPRTFGYLANLPEASIITGRGCAFNCAFCASNKMHGGKVRLVSSQNVYDEIVYLRNKFGVGMINILDDTFLLDYDRVRNICNLLIDNKVDMKWFCLTRVDKTDIDLLLLMKKAGCLSLAIGFETGSNRLLKLMNKRATVEQGNKAIESAVNAGLKINGQLMVGLPTETDEDIEATANFIKTNPDVDTFGLHIFQPFPGCDVWENPEKYEYKIDKNTDFSNYHTIGKQGSVYQCNDKKVVDRYNYLKDVIGDRSRELRK